MSTKGAMIASAVAGLFLTGAPVLAAPKEGGKVHCSGVNACKGKGSCHSASNGCQGQNSCKGKGLVEMSEKDCKAKGGTVPAEKK